MQSDRPTLIVAGLGRCGTSLVMRMLDAAGVPTVGEYPAWEDRHAQRLLEDRPDEWAELVKGKAVKVLDAHRWRMPDLGEYDLLWLGRDPREQAKSMVKLMSMAFSMIQPDRKTIRALAKSIENDTPAAIKSIRAGRKERHGLAFRFEAIVQQPLVTAHAICAGFGLDPAKAETMAAQVVKRPPTCLPYMMEASLV